MAPRAAAGAPCTGAGLPAAQATDTFAAWTSQSRGGGALSEAYAGVDFSTGAYTPETDFTRRRPTSGCSP